LNDLFIDVNPIPVKQAMELLGYPVGPCRMPLVDMDPAKIEQLKNSINKVGLQEHINV